MLDKTNTGLVIVDIQGKLATLVQDSERLIDNVVRMVRAARILDMPVIWLEQNPENLGRTAQPLREVLEPQEPIIKYSFGGCGEPAFIEAVQETQADNWLMCGIEAHICVYQTAMGLERRGFHVEVVADGVSSRESSNLDLALSRMAAEGITVTGVEMSLFELMGDCKVPEFRDVLGLIK